jgi:hypothetical protein
MEVRKMRYTKIILKSPCRLHVAVSVSFVNNKTYYEGKWKYLSCTAISIVQVALKIPYEVQQTEVRHYQGTENIPKSGQGKD